MNQVTDEEVVARVLQGEGRLFAILVDRYKQALYNYIVQSVRNPEEAADLAQETFLRAYKSLSKYRGQASVKNWMYRIAHNICYDYLRKKRVSSSTFWETLVPNYKSQPPKESPEEILIAQDRQRDIKWAIEQLSPTYKEVIILYHFQECSYEEIADILNTPKRTIETRLYRARKKLKDLLKGGSRPNALPLGTKSNAKVSKQTATPRG